MRKKNGVLEFAMAITLLSVCSCTTSNKIIHKDQPHFTIDAEIDQSLTPFIEGIMNDFNLPGLAIGIVKEEEIVYAKGFGFENIQTKRPITTSTIFHMASVSKPFVATAIMQLVEKGVIHLDSTLVSYLPYFKLNSNEYKNITIRQMLAHSSGMPASNGYDWDKPTYSEDAIEKYVRSLTEEKLTSEPGSTFQYSNIAFDCLGDVISKVSGMPFSEYVEKNILKPIGMIESSFLKPKHLPKNWASPHNRILIGEVWDGYPYNRMHAPSSTLHSNVIEMCQWAITNLNKGRYLTTKILDTTVYDQLWHPWTITDWGTKIGLSWFLEEHNTTPIIEHSGGDTGFSAQLILIPDSSMAIVVMINQSPSPFEIVTYGAMDILHDKKPGQYKIPAIIPFGIKMQEKGIAAAQELWQNLFDENSDVYAFNAHQINNLSRKLIRNQRTDEAMELIKFNIDKFPENPVSYDTYGDILLFKKDTINAIRQYDKALSLNPDFARSKKKLATLKISN